MCNETLYSLSVVKLHSNFVSSTWRLTVSINFVNSTLRLAVPNSEIPFLWLPQ
jgi:hypothetical protein